MFHLAHLSDLHVTRPRPGRPGELLGKRGLSWLSWRVGRRREHRRAVWEAVLRDLEGLAPGHVAVTGDLTHLGLPGELEEAEAWLRRIGPPERVSVVPGNHDVLVGARDAARGLWPAYTGPRCAAGATAAGAAEAPGYPAVRVQGGLALVGLSSARPTPPLLATGRLGERQCRRLEEALGALGDAGLVRVVLIHHAPTAGGSPRRRLVDAERLRGILRRTGAELVLHGHVHRAAFDTLPGPRGPIPVVAAPSASAPSAKDPARRAGYHLFSIEPAAGRAPRIEVVTRTFDPAGGTFHAAVPRRLA